MRDLSEAAAAAGASPRRGRGEEFCRFQTGGRGPPAPAESTPPRRPTSCAGGRRAKASGFVGRGGSSAAQACRWPPAGPGGVRKLRAARRTGAPAAGLRARLPRAGDPGGCGAPGLCHAGLGDQWDAGLLKASFRESLSETPKSEHCWWAAVLSALPSPGIQVLRASPKQKCGFMFQVLILVTYLLGI